jgi:murein DD-endopeptidase MepM/ murein hydrolase activator NlpD
MNHQSRPYRLMTVGVFAAFVLSLAAVFLSDPLASAQADPPTLLPAAYANPGEVSLQDTLHAGETLSQLLQRVELAESEARALLAEVRAYQDPRRLQPGSVISLRRSYNSGTVRAVALRLDADRTLNMERDGSGWRGQVDEVPVYADTAVLSGSVESSLYAALLGGEGGGVSAEERRRVADLLADRIFAWQIDFSRDLRVGDEFRILYERMVRPDGTARTGHVIAAQFSINRRDYEAYAFELETGTLDYFDGRGESLRRAFLRAPLQFRRISSAFSTGRFHPVLRRSRPHHGIDYAANSGTPVRAVGDGVVRRANWGGGYGNLIEIRHQRGYSTRYAHLRGFARGIRAGVRVKQGDVIGYVGSTGLSTGPHLHYEFHENGRPVNPNNMRFVSGDPVPQGEVQAFRSTMREQVAALDRYSGAVLLARNDESAPAAAGR